MTERGTLAINAARQMQIDAGLTIQRLRAALRDAEAQRDTLAQERAFAQANHAGFCPEMGEWRGRAEALETALREAEKLIAEELEPHESESSSAGVDWVRRVLVEVRRALAGEPREAIDGDCGLTVEQQAEEARSQAEYEREAREAAAAQTGDDG